MRLSTIRDRTKGLDIDLGEGDTVHVEYRIHYMTGKIFKEMQAILAEKEESDDKDEETENPRLLEQGTRWLCLLVTKWDITDDKDKPFPLDAEKLMEAGMSADVAWSVIGKIMEDVRTVGEANAPS